MSWVREKTPPDSVLHCPYDAFVFLYSQRKSFWGPPTSLLVVHQENSGELLPEGALALAKSLREQKVSYVILPAPARGGVDEWLNRFADATIKRYPQAFTLVKQSGSGGNRIYQVNPSILPAP